MVGFRWIVISSLLILMLSAAETGLSQQLVSRDGGAVTLPCGRNQDKCDHFNWFFSDTNQNPAVQLIELGEIGKEAMSKFNRLAATENCSLIVTNVTIEDVGQYSCRRSDDLTYIDVHLSVASITEHRGTAVTLSCSVKTPGSCIYKLKWQYNSQNINKENSDTKEMETGEAECLVTVKFPASFPKNNPKYLELFKCEVSEVDDPKQQYNFFPQSFRKPGEGTTVATTLTKGTTENGKNAGNNSELPPDDTPTLGSWWWYIAAAVGSVALIIFIVVLIRWKRSKGVKTPVDKNTADPEDGVSYASISYTNKSRKAQVKNDNDEGEMVTYSTVKASASSTRASEDPSTLYATVNKNK